MEKVQRLNQPILWFLVGTTLTVLASVLPASALTANRDRLLSQSQPQATSQKSVPRNVTTQVNVDVPALRRAIKHPNWQVRRAAAIALGKLGVQAKSAVPELTTALRDKNYEVIKAAIEALGNIGEAAAPAVPAIIKHLTTPLYDDSSMWQRVASALTKIGKPAIPAMIELLNSRFDTIRYSAISALRGMGEPAIPSLIQALRSPKWSVRHGAAKALMMGETARAAVPSLIERLTNQQTGERDGLVRSQIIETLGANRIEAPTVVPVLIQMLPHPDAVEALGKFQGESSSAVSALAKLLHDRSQANDNSRIGAVRTLSKLGQASQSAIPDLKYALTDPSYIVRREAAETLVRLGATAEFDAAIATVVESLKSSDRTERSYAAGTLGKIGIVSVHRSVTELVQAIQINQKLDDFQRHATSALIEIAHTLNKNRSRGTVSSADIQVTVQGLKAAEQVWQEQQQKLSRLAKQLTPDDERFGLSIAQGAVDLTLQQIRRAVQVLYRERS